MDEVEDLREEVEYWRDQYYEEVERNREEVEQLREKIDELENNDNVTIKDLNHFVWLLKCDGLYNDQLDMFIEEYMKFHNN